ncbi:MAG: DUF6259 domain-containing protein [Planctomycetota bacterium]
MWRQIPYPPDLPEPPSSSEHPPIVLEGEHIRFIGDSRSGRGLQLEHRRTGTRFLAPRAPGVSFRLYTKDGLYLDGTAVETAPTLRVAPDSRSLTLLFDRPAWHGHSWPLRLELEVRLRGEDALEFQFEVEHLGGAPREVIIERVQYPVLSGVREFAGPATQLLLPFIGGERRPEPATRCYADFEYIYPNEAMSFMDLYSKQEGLYLASYDERFAWTVMRGRRLVRAVASQERASVPSLELLFETTPYLREGERFRSQPFVVAVHAGDWHSAADRYRDEWLQSWFRPPRTPSWVRELKGLVELFFEITDESGVHRYDAPTLLEYMRRCHAEMGLEVAHVCGYHEGGFDARYPLYEPLAWIGGAQGLRDFFVACRREQGWTSDIYMNARIMDIATRWWHETGRDWACVSKDGTVFTEYYNGRTFAIACPSIPDRIAFWCAKAETLLRLGAKGLQVDQPHTTAREDWEFEAHGHRTPFDHWGTGQMALFTALRERQRALDPESWSWGEAASDVFSQYFDISCLYSRYPDQRVFFGETDPSTRRWVDDVRGYGAPEVFRYVCPEIPLLQAPLLKLDQPDAMVARLNLMWIFSTIIYWPGLAVDHCLDRIPAEFRRYLARLWRLRHEHRDLLIHGRFVDDRGLTVSDPRVYAKRYVAPRATAVVAANRSLDERIEVEILLDLEEGETWRFQAASLEEEPVSWSHGGGGRVSLAIPANGAALVVWRREPLWGHCGTPCPTGPGEPA